MLYDFSFFLTFSFFFLTSAHHFDTTFKLLTKIMSISSTDPIYVCLYLFMQAEDKQGNEIKKLRNELSRANEKVATLSTQLLTSVRDLLTGFFSSSPFEKNLIIQSSSPFEKNLIIQLTIISLNLNSFISLIDSVYPLDPIQTKLPPFSNQTFIIRYSLSSLSSSSPSSSFTPFFVLMLFPFRQHRHC